MSELLDAIEATVEDMRERAAMKTYEWRQVPGTKLVKPFCLLDGKPYGWAMEISKDYPKSVNKHTRTHHAHPVVYQGLLVQVWKCPACKDTVVK